MEQRGPIGPDFDWLAPMMTQGCESDSGTRTGRFPTARDGLTRDDQDVASESKMANGSSCGAFCGARIPPSSWRCCLAIDRRHTRSHSDQTQTFTASGSAMGIQETHSLSEVKAETDRLFHR